MTSQPSSHFGTEPSDFFCMPFSRVLQVVHVDELSEEPARGKRRLPYNGYVCSGTSAPARLVPDAWACGSFSGNIALEYDWPQLTQGSRFYWLGTEPQVPERCRILVTTTSREGLIEYDPRLDLGPWQVGPSGIHTWNSRVNLEFLVDASLSLASITRVFCVRHDVSRCDERGIDCADLGLGSRMAGALLLANSLGGSPLASQLAPVFHRADRESWLKALVRQLSRCPVGGATHAGTTEARELTHRLAAAFAKHNKADVLQLVKQFASHQDLADELRQVLYDSEDGAH